MPPGMTVIWIAFVQFVPDEEIEKVSLFLMATADKLNTWIKFLLAAQAVGEWMVYVVKSAYYPQFALKEKIWENIRNE